MAATGECVAYAFPQLSDVELQIVVRIFSLLPTDQRLRAAEVSRGWRATVALPALWRRLDLSPGSGVARVPRSLLLAALARAGGALTALDLPDVFFYTNDMVNALRASGALVELRLGMKYPVPVADVSKLLAAAPQLRELHTGIACDMTQAVGLLESRPPFAPLRLFVLSLLARYQTHPPALVRALLDTSLQPNLAQLQLGNADLHAPGAFDSMVDALVLRRLSRLSLVNSLLPNTASALARALRDGALVELCIINCTPQFLVAGSWSLELGDALRANSTLTSLILQLGLNWTTAAVALLGALVGHRSLRKLDLTHTRLYKRVPRWRRCLRLTRRR